MTTISQMGSGEEGQRPGYRGGKESQEYDDNIKNNTSCVPDHDVRREVVLQSRVPCPTAYKEQLQGGFCYPTLRCAYVKVCVCKAGTTLTGSDWFGCKTVKTKEPKAIRGKED